MSAEPGVFEPPVTLTRAEVASLFKVSESTVKRWECAGVVRRVEPAGRPRYAAAELLALVEAGR